MSLSGNIAIKILRLLHPGKGSFNNIEKCRKKAERENLKSAFSMPKSRKAFFSLADNTEYPCLIIRSKKKNACDDKKAVMFIYGGITRCWKIQLNYAVDYANYTGVDVWYPIYPPVTQVNISKSISVLYEIYKIMTEQYNSSKIAVIGVSFGGNLALSLIDSNNRAATPVNMPGIIIAHSPGGIPDCSDDLKFFQKYENSDPFFSVSDIKMLQKLTDNDTDIPNYTVKPIHQIFKNAPPTYIYYGEEVLAGNAPSYRKAFERDGSKDKIHINIKNNMMHCYSCTPVFPESKEAYFETVELIKKL